MTDSGILRLLKIVMLVGIGLIILGVYFHNFSPAVEAMGVRGIILSAVCVAVGMALSLPTKMYITFILVKRETAERPPNDAEARTDSRHA